MTHTLLILNDAPHGTERAHDALRLAGALAGKQDPQVRRFLLANRTTAADKVPVF